MHRPDLLISGEEVAKHNTRESCWIIVHGGVDSSKLSRANFLYIFGTENVYDVTQFLDGTHCEDVKGSYQVSFLQSTPEGQGSFSSMGVRTQQKVRLALRLNRVYQPTIRI